MTDVDMFKVSLVLAEMILKDPSKRVFNNCEPPELPSKCCPNDNDIMAVKQFISNCKKWISAEGPPGRSRHMYYPPFRQITSRDGPTTPSECRLSRGDRNSSDPRPTGTNVMRIGRDAQMDPFTLLNNQPRRPRVSQRLGLALNFELG